MEIKHYLRCTLYRIEGHSQNLSNVVGNYSIIAQEKYFDIDQVL